MMMLSSTLSFLTLCPQDLCGAERIAKLPITAVDSSSCLAILSVFGSRTLMLYSEAHTH